MPNNNSKKNDTQDLIAKMQDGIRRHAPELKQMVGVSILAGLTACGLLPIASATLPISEGLKGVVAGVSGNTLANVVYDWAKEQAKGKPQTEKQYLESLARTLGKLIKENEALREDINRLLRQTNAVYTALTALKPISLQMDEYSHVIRELKEIQQSLKPSLNFSPPPESHIVRGGQVGMGYFTNPTNPVKNSGF